MEESINLHDVDRREVEDRIADLIYDEDFNLEYESLCWMRDLFYLVDEGFVALSPSGLLFSLDRCPDTL